MTRTCAWEHRHNPADQPYCAATERISSSLAFTLFYPGDSVLAEGKAVPGVSIITEDGAVGDEHDLHPSLVHHFTEELGDPGLIRRRDVGESLVQCQEAASSGGQEEDDQPQHEASHRSRSAAPGVHDRG